MEEGAEQGLKATEEAQLRVRWEEHQQGPENEQETDSQTADSGLVIAGQLITRKLDEGMFMST